MISIFTDVNYAKKIMLYYNYNDEQYTLHLLLSTSISEITTSIRKTKVRAMDKVVILTTIPIYIFLMNGKSGFVGSSKAAKSQ